MHLDRNGTVTVIAGTGKEGNRNGSNSFAAFGQPMGLCSEGDNIFLRDAQIGTIKLVIKVTRTIQFLENLRQFYGAFSVHLKNSSTKRHTIEMVKDVSAYIKSTVLSVQEIQNSHKSANGPQ